ncbi:LOW QUALITY PROTEIN: hypothetical protein ACHAW5_005276 [Stephanodiscus triporus]|uniref:Uncharacterized protein n=1 Tax=Stephanodiscus triporus TaxID=2934178 RepID=A0ABD3P046_9STRA
MGPISRSSSSGQMGLSDTATEKHYVNLQLVQSPHLLLSIISREYTKDKNILSLGIPSFRYSTTSSARHLRKKMQSLIPGHRDYNPNNRILKTINFTTSSNTSTTTSSKWKDS